LSSSFSSINNEDQMPETDNQALQWTFPLRLEPLPYRHHHSSSSNPSNSIKQNIQSPVQGPEINWKWQSQTVTFSKVMHFE